MPTEDTQSLIAQGLTPPRRSLHLWIGFVLGAGTILWLASIAGVVQANDHDFQRARINVLAAAASTLTICAVIIAAGVAKWRANMRDHVTLQRDLEARAQRAEEQMGRVSAQLEQLSAKVERIDPWTIYTAVAEDFFAKEGRRRDT